MIATKASNPSIASEISNSSNATPRMASQIVLVCLSTAVNASGRWRMAWIRAKIVAPSAASHSTSMIIPVNRFTKFTPP